jgi:hypothetical protein
LGRGALLGEEFEDFDVSVEPLAPLEPVLSA